MRKPSRSFLNVVILGWAALATTVWDRPVLADVILLSTSIGVRTQDFRIPNQPPIEHLLSDPSGSFFFGAGSNSGFSSDAAIAFSFLELPTGSHVASAKLYVDVALIQSTTPSPVTLMASAYFNGSPKVSLSDFHLPMVAIGNADSLPRNLKNDSDLFVTFDVTNQVGSQLDRGTQNFGFSLQRGGGEGTFGVWGNFNDLPRRPYLVLTTAVPEPSIFMLTTLAGMAGSVVVICRRGQRNAVKSQ